MYRFQIDEVKGAVRGWSKQKLFLFIYVCRSFFHTHSSTGGNTLKRWQKWKVALYPPHHTRSTNTARTQQLNNLLNTKKTRTTMTGVTKFVRVGSKVFFYPRSTRTNVSFKKHTPHTVAYVTMHNAETDLCVNSLLFLMAGDFMFYFIYYFGKDSKMKRFSLYSASYCNEIERAFLFVSFTELSHMST